MATAGEAKKAMLAVSSVVKEVLAMGAKEFAKEQLTEIGRLFERAEQSYRDGEFDDTIGFAKQANRIAEEARKLCETGSTLKERIAGMREYIQEVLGRGPSASEEEGLLKVDSLVRRAEEVLVRRTGLQEGLWLIDEAEEILRELPEPEQPMVLAEAEEELDEEESPLEDDQPEEIQERETTQEVMDAVSEAFGEAEEQESPPPTEGQDAEDTSSVPETEEVSELSEEVREDKSSVERPSGSRRTSEREAELTRAQDRLSDLERLGAIEVCPAIYRRAFRALTDAEDLIGEEEEEESLAALKTAQDAMAEMEKELVRSSDVQKSSIDEKVLELEGLLRQIENTDMRSFVEEEVGVIHALIESAKQDTGHQDWELAVSKVERALTNARGALDTATQLRGLKQKQEKCMSFLLPALEALKSEGAERYAGSSFQAIAEAVLESQSCVADGRYAESLQPLEKLDEKVRACAEEVRSAQESERSNQRKESIKSRLDVLEGKILDEVESEGAPTYLPDEYKTFFRLLNLVRRSLRKDSIDEAESTIGEAEISARNLKESLRQAKEEARQQMSACLEECRDILQSLSDVPVASLRSVQIRALTELLDGLSEGEDQWRVVEQQAKSIRAQTVNLRQELSELQSQKEEIDRRKPRVHDGLARLVEAKSEAYVPEAWAEILTLRSQAQDAEEEGKFSMALALYDKMLSALPKVMADTEEKREQEKQEALRSLSEQLDILEKELEDLERVEVIQYMPAEYRAVCKALKEAGQSFRKEDVAAARTAIQQARSTIDGLQVELKSKLSDRKAEVEKELVDLLASIQGLEAQESSSLIPDALEEVRVLFKSCRSYIETDQMGTAEEKIRETRFKVSEAARRLVTAKELQKKCQSFLQQVETGLQKSLPEGQEVPSEIVSRREDISKLMSAFQFDVAIVKCEELLGVVADWQSKRQEEDKAKEKAYRREKAVFEQTWLDVLQAKAETRAPELYRQVSESRLRSQLGEDEGRWDIALSWIEKASEKAEELLSICEKSIDGESEEEDDETDRVISKELSGIHEILTGLKSVMSTEGEEKRGQALAKSPEPPSEKASPPQKEAKREKAPSEGRGVPSALEALEANNAKTIAVAQVKKEVPPSAESPSAAQPMTPSQEDELAENTVAELEEMSKEWGVEVSKGVLYLIAREMKGRPELFGDVLQSILSRSLLTGQKIDTDLARDVLSEYIG